MPVLHLPHRLMRVAQANMLMTEARPWAAETPPAVAADVQALVFETLRQTGILLQPVMPEKTALLLDAFGMTTGKSKLEDDAFGRMGIGVVSHGVRLFDVSRWK